MHGKVSLEKCRFILFYIVIGENVKLKYISLLRIEMDVVVEKLIINEETLNFRSLFYLVRSANFTYVSDYRVVCINKKKKVYLV